MCENMNIDNKNESKIKHPDDNGTAIVGEINSKTKVFNIQSNGSKPYDTNNMIKQSEGKWGDYYNRFFIVA